MREQPHQIVKKDKGKARQMDHAELLAQLNELMGLLLIPISLPELAVATPSLLLAVVESILQRRFLPLHDPTRTTRTPHGRAKCLKILIYVLGQNLDPHLNGWSPDSINFPRLIQADMNELLKVIDGILKLSRLSRNSTLHHHKETHSQGMSRKHQNESKPQERVSKNHKHESESIPATKYPRSSRISSLNSSSSSLSVEPCKIPFDGLYSPIGPPLDQSSLNLPSRRSSMTNSSNGPLSRSLNSQQLNEDPVSGQTSNPPTLRNLLGPLHAQMMNSKRPHTPRTAHRVMVNKLRNEGAHDDPEEQTLNHDTDVWMAAKTQADENNDSTVDESRYQFSKGLSLMTLDGIEPDDPFVSIETRRALESQIIPSQTNISFDLTKLAVAGSEISNRSFQSFDYPRKLSCLPESRQAHKSLNDIWPASSSSAISNHLQNSNQPASDLDGSLGQFCQGDHSQDHGSVRSTGPAPGGSLDHHPFFSRGSIESNFEEEHPINRSNYGFGRPTDSIKMRSRDNSFQNHYPTSIPLPASPTQSDFSSSRHGKVLLASEGVQLDLVVSDVMTYEQEKHQQVNVQGWDWMDLTQLAHESERIEKTDSAVNIGNKKTNTHTNLLSRKLELLRLLMQTYGHNKSFEPSEHPSPQGAESNAEEKLLRAHDEQKENVRIRVSRQSGGMDSINYPERPANGFVVLNKSHHIRGAGLTATAHPATSRTFILDYSAVHHDQDCEDFDDRQDLLDDVL
ncbi:hypothetical protein PCASD_02991 [Puccinia coronata f. sp. avenae]|uniref:DUF5745 domain-containing protein n=1 Tax=Puccinia coronata f. sp. avenae TaxID=200324 RepID=A0A2N5VGK7_9BASI|nr:hypothetical protein PCASD_02991 [Puccinia coronata f. sp. avenae]